MCAAETAQEQGGPAHIGQVGERLALGVLWRAVRARGQAEPELAVERQQVLRDQLGELLLPVRALQQVDELVQGCDLAQRAGREGIIERWCCCWRVCAIRPSSLLRTC